MKNTLSSFIPTTTPSVCLEKDIEFSFESIADIEVTASLELADIEEAEGTALSMIASLNAISVYITTNAKDADVQLVNMMHSRTLEPVPAALVELPSMESYDTDSDIEIATESISASIKKLWAGIQSILMSALAQIPQYPFGHLGWGAFLTSKS